MGTYYRHMRTEKAEVPYSFQCEHCGKESGPLTAVIIGPEATYNSSFKTLSPDREEKLCKEAHGKLVRRLQETHKNAVEKKIFSVDFKDQCPFCQQPQSWAVSGLKKKMYENPGACLGVGTIIALIALACHYYGDMEYVTIPMAIGIFAAGAAAALGCLVWNLVKIQNKTKKATAGVQHFPVIEWNAVRNMLNEQS